MKKVGSKKGISPVIAVVMLLLLTIVAVTIIIAFVVPFVRENLDESGACFDVLGDLSFAETPYNCYVDAPVGEEGTGFSVRINNDNIVGFRVALESEGSSTAREIEPDNNVFSDLRMLSGDNNQLGNPLEIPKKGEVRTYVADAVYTKADLFAILDSGAKCELADNIQIKVCEEQAVIDLVENP